MKLNYSEEYEKLVVINKRKMKDEFENKLNMLNKESENNENFKSAKDY